MGTRPRPRRGVRSNVLQLAVYVRDDELRWFDPASGQDLYDYEELHRLRDEAVAQARVARAEARVAELEALLKERGDVSRPR